MFMPPDRAEVSLRRALSAMKRSAMKRSEMKKSALKKAMKKSR
jgi:hypothetical protein